MFYRGRRDLNKGVSNLAEFAHEIWPQAHIYSSPAISSGFAPEFDENGNLVAVEYNVFCSREQIGAYHIPLSQTRRTGPRYYFISFITHIFSIL